MADSISATEAKKVEKVVEKPAPKKSGKKYFRANQYAGFKIIVDQPSPSDPTLVKYVKFTKVDRNVGGYSKPVGYLETSDAKVIKVCESKGYIEEISEKDFANGLKG